MARILIVCHERDRALGPDYILSGLVEPWRRHGHDVVIQFGWRERPPADLLIPHIDVTRLPADAVAMLAAYPRVINRALTDISKRRVSRNLLRRDDAWPGPVIVKTDANHAGIPDATRRPLRRTIWQRLTKRWPPLNLPLHPGKTYRVHDRLADVPDAVWRNPAWVVERYLAERDGDDTVLRSWIILGDKTIERRQLARAPIPVGDPVHTRETWIAEPSRDLRGLRAEFGIDFGKIDFARVDGQVVHYDIATTPTSSEFLSRPEFCAHVARGIEDFLERSGSARLRG